MGEGYIGKSLILRNKKDPCAGNVIKVMTLSTQGFLCGTRLAQSLAFARSSKSNPQEPRHRNIHSIGIPESPVAGRTGRASHMAVR